MPIETGRCGDHLVWSLDRTQGLLTITGEGPMWDYARYWEDGPVPPWRGMALTLRLEGEITSIGRAAFEGCYIEEVELPPSVRTVGMAAFDECGIQSLRLCEGLEFIGEIAFFGNAFSKLILPSTLQVVGDRAFGGPGGFLEYIAMPTGIRSFGFPNDWTEGAAYIFAEGFQGPRRIDLYGPMPVDWAGWWPVFAFYEGEVGCPAGWMPAGLPDLRAFACYPGEDPEGVEPEDIAANWRFRTEVEEISMTGGVL